MFLFWLALGIISGALVTNVLWIIKTSNGWFKIDRSNPEKDVCRLVIEDINEVAKKKYILLKIDSNADLSQK